MPSACCSACACEGPQSNKALLGVGWADSAEKQFTKALVPWLELRDRNMLDAAVQESYLAIPYAYAQLDANKQAAEQYTLAVAAFGEEAQRIDQSIAAIRSGRLLDAIVANDKGEQRGLVLAAAEPAGCARDPLSLSPARHRTSSRKA